jgi:hypothetical protein
MTAEEMKNDILSEISVELSSENSFNRDFLSVKIVNAIREVKRARKYPNFYTEEMIDADMEQFYPNVKNIALFDYNQIGIEWQSASSENGESRTFIDRNKLFYGIIPFAE